MKKILFFLTLLLFIGGCSLSDLGIENTTKKDYRQYTYYKGGEVEDNNVKYGPMVDGFMNCLNTLVNDQKVKENDKYTCNKNCRIEKEYDNMQICEEVVRSWDTGLPTNIMFEDYMMEHKDQLDKEYKKNM